MLLGLHVKNLALIEKADVEFTVEGLNILTGETGAGKSIIIGSVGHGAGRQGVPGHASARARTTPTWSCAFSVDDPEKIKALEALEVGAR